MTEKNRGFLPQAPSFNRHAVHRAEPVSHYELLGGTGKPISAGLGAKALTTLALRRDQYHATKDAPIDEIAGLILTSRNELVIQAATIISQHAAHYGMEGKSLEAIHHAGLAGCGDVVAFLEVIARMQAKDNEGIFNEESYRESAIKSLRTLLYIAATSNDADEALTKNISTWTRKDRDRLSDEELYGGLQFDDSFFALQADGSVQLRSDKETRKRILRDGRRHFDFSVSKRDIMLGCPYRQRLSLLYRPMLDAMISNGFAEEMYTSSQKTAD